MRRAYCFWLLIATACIVAGASLAQSSAHPAPTFADCSRAAGSDAGAKIQACLDELPSGGIADARGLAGQQAIQQSIRLSHPGTILMLAPAATFTFADGTTLDISASDVHIEGAGTTSVLRLGNDSSVRIGSRQQPVWGWHLERLAIEPASGKRPAAGLLLNNAREGILREISVSGFPGRAIDVGDNCWSNRSIDNRVVKNDIGYNFHGDQLNAWNIRGGMINVNRIGLNFELAKGLLQGFSITDGVQMEGNSETAVRLASGEMRGIFLSNIYSELFHSQRLIKCDPTGDLKILLLSVTDSYIYSRDTSPISISTRSQDIASVTITNVILRHSQRDLPIAEASGLNSFVVLSDSHSYSGEGFVSKSPILSTGGAHTTAIRTDVPGR
jgi:hypothetical protein